MQNVHKAWLALTEHKSVLRSEHKISDHLRTASGIVHLISKLRHESCMFIYLLQLLATATGAKNDGGTVYTRQARTRTYTTGSTLPQDNLCIVKTSTIRRLGNYSRLQDLKCAENKEYVVGVTLQEGNFSLYFEVFYFQHSIHTSNFLSHVILEAFFLFLISKLITWSKTPVRCHLC